MKHLLLILFGHKPVTNLPKYVTKFKSSYPSNKPTFQQWVKEYNVSMLYDRKIIHL